jgi:hypothetical protein
LIIVYNFPNFLENFYCTIEHIYIMLLYFIKNWMNSTYNYIIIEYCKWFFLVRCQFGVDVIQVVEGTNNISIAML